MDAHRTARESGLAVLPDANERAWHGPEKMAPWPPSPAPGKNSQLNRAAVLEHFNTTQDDYAVIFTPNATGACRLIGEAYPFRRRSRLVLTADNHNSVNGLREFPRARGARVAYVPLTVSAG